MKAKIDKKLLKNLSPNATLIDIYDTGHPGLVLRVLPSGTMTYFLVYHIDGRKRRMKIGNAATMTPTQARDVCRIKAAEVAFGGDPGKDLLLKRTERVEAKGKTVGGYFELTYKPMIEERDKSGKATAARIKACFEQDFFNKALSEVTPLMIHAWRKKRLASVTPHTVNRDENAFKAMLANAAEMGKIAKSPLAGMKKIKCADNSRVRYLSKDEQDRLHAALDQRERNAIDARHRLNEWRRQRNLDPLPAFPEAGFIDHLQPIIILAMNTGLRRGELFSLLWSDLDLINNSLTVRAAAAKGARKRHVPLNKTARAMLKRWGKDKDTSGLVFPGKGGKRLDNISTSWSNLLTAAQIDGFNFHDLRHHFATMTLKAGCDIVTLSKLLGHKTLEMTLRYAHVTDEAAVSAVDRLAEGGV